MEHLPAKIRGRNPFDTEAAILAAYIDGQWIRGELCREDSLGNGPFVAIIKERLTKSRNGTAGWQAFKFAGLASAPSPRIFRPICPWHCLACYCAMSASLKELGDELDKFPEVVDLTDRDIQKHATELIINMDNVRKAVLQLSPTDVKRVC
ncbi:uncharacterized protein PG986_009697 [Apiospora aurea]|uniref:Uncharacterized protein n=1 Tax=Apiospora aurea TaxID=335848 RepID=A0ABR1Q8E8_9PEZI